MATREDSSFRYFTSDIDQYSALARDIRKSNVDATINYYYFNDLNLGGLELIERVLKTTILSLLKTL
jgi:replication-associated recombination protein RarA